MKTNFKSYSTIDVGTNNIGIIDIGTNNIGINYLKYVIDNETGRYIEADIESKPNYVILKLYSSKDELLSSCEFNINSVVSCELDLINKNIIITNSNSQNITCDISGLIDPIAAAYDHSQLITGNPHNVIAEEISYDNTTSGLTATDVNSAIDEIDNVLDNLDLDYLQDVAIDTPLDGQVLIYDETSTQFVNAQLTAEVITFDNTSTEMSATTVQEAIDEIDNALDNLTFETDVTIDITDWVADGVTATYKAIKTVTGVLASDSPILAFDLTGIADTAWTTSRTEFAKIGLANTTDDDEITFYASEIPTEDITVIVKVVR